MNRRLLAVLALAAFVASGCLVRGKSQEEKEAEAQQAAAGADHFPGLDEYWREGKLPPGLEEGTPVRGGTLTVRLNGQPPSLNYLLDSDYWLSRITLHNLHETLVRPDPRDHPDYEMIPELAERWEVSEDNLTFTFHLRDGVKWHDGKPFTARDVRFTFDRMMDPSVRAMHLRQAFEDLERVETPDERTVIFRYEKPYVWALRKLGEIPILPAHAFEGVEGAAFNSHPYQRAPIGTGPFRFESWEDHKAITFARNDDYWGRKAWVDKVVYRVLPEPNVAQQLLMRGELDIDTTLTSESYVQLAAEPKVVDTFHRVKFFESMFAWIGWNHQRPIFQDARVRRALAMLFDREKLRISLFEGIPENANCVFYHLGPGCDPADRQPAFDPDGAAKLLREAGWQDTDGDGVLDRDGVPFRFTLTIPSGSPTNEAMVLVFKQELYRAGIEMELQKIEWSVFSNRLRNHEFDACMLAWIGDVESDPYQVWHSSQAAGGSNYISYANDELDELALRIRGEFDYEKRQALFRRFNQIVVEEAPMLLIYHLPRRTMIHRRLRGVYLSPMEFFQVRDMWIQPAATAAIGG